MLKKYKAFNLLYLLLFIVQLIAASFSFQIVTYIVTPLSLLSLLVFLTLKTKLKGRFHRRLFCGLLFTSIGELLFLFHDHSSTYGWLAIMLAYFCYTRAFYLDFRSAQELDKKNARIAIAFFTVLGMGFYVFLRPYLGAIRIPAMAYIFLLSVMLMMSVFRNLRVNRESFTLIFSGALLFLISDCLYAIDHYVQPFPMAGILILAIAMAAKYFLVTGGVERKLLHQ
ncbi:lysoplasmalogenase [Pedobacter sp.]|uniref:lysoplasmalogenase n=1 Tax=Pedobacter sp. TaxID=1411316 RepID=UPI003D7F88D4